MSNQTIYYKKQELVQLVQVNNYALDESQILVFLAV